MNKYIQIILLVITAILMSQAWGYAPTASQLYTYDAGGFLYIDGNIESESQKLNYDDKLYFFIHTEYLQTNSTDSKPLNGTFFAFIGDIVVPKKGDVLLDSSVVPNLRKNPTLDGRIKPGENPVVSNVTRPELRNAVSTGNLKGVPGALDDLPVVNPATSINTRINIRGQLPAGRGRFGDGVIGAQAVEGQMPLITNDAALGAAVRAAGGVVR